jgi:glyoxylase-like metal-dependent hydrolase (beta-lactamase superfamily II)
VFPHAKVYLPRAELAMLDHSTPRFLGLLHNKALKVAAELLDDKQIMSIGSASIKCLSTPGHTLGSMSYLINNSLLIVGDIVNLKQGKVVMDRGFMQLSKRNQRESILRLSQLQGVSCLCTAHSGYTKDFAEAMKNWITPQDAHTSL